MNINSLGGPRMTPLTSANSASSTARTSFGSLIQGPGAAKAGGAGQLTGGNIVSAAITINHGSPGAGVGAPYQQALPPVYPGAPGAAAPGAARPAAPGSATPGSEFSGELKATYDEQKMAMMKQLAVLSLASFASGTFSLGQNKIQLDTAD
jgi:hypothetical protein